MFFPLLWYPEQLYYSSIDEPDTIEDTEEFDLSFLIEDVVVTTPDLIESLLDEQDSEDFSEDFDINLLVFENFPIESLLDEPNIEDDYQSEDIIFPSYIEDDFVNVCFYDNEEVYETSEEDLVEPLPIALLVSQNNFDELIVCLLDEIDFEDEDENLPIDPISDYTIIIVSTDEELFQPAPDEDWNEEEPDESYFDFSDFTTPEIVITSSGRQLTEEDVLRSWMKFIRSKGR